MSRRGTELEELGAGSAPDAADGGGDVLGAGGAPEAGSAPEGAPAPRPAHSLPRRSFKLILGIVFIYLGFFGQVVGFILGSYISGNELFFYAMAELTSALVVCCGICLLGGSAALRPSGRQIRDAMRSCWWLLVVDAGFGILSFVSDASSYHGQLLAQWLPNLVWCALMCVGVGLTEEGMYRGLLLGGFLGVAGRRRAGIAFSVVASAVIFGCAHVFPLDEGTTLDTLTVVQMLLKIAQTGICGGLWAAVVVRQRNLTGVAWVHALSDFFLMAGSAIFVGAEETTATDYVVTGTSDALVTIAYYGVTIALYLPLVVRTVRMLRRSTAPNYGIFEQRG